MTPEVRQFDRPPLTIGEGGQRFFHFSCERDLEHFVLDVGGSCLRSHSGFVFLPCTARGLRADEIDATAVGMRQQERPERTSSCVELARIVPQAKEHLLGDLLRQRFITEDAAGKSVHRSRVARVDLRQGLFGTLFQANDEGGVFHCGEVRSAQRIPHGLSTAATRPVGVPYQISSKSRCCAVEVPRVARTTGISEKEFHQCALLDASPS